MCAVAGLLALRTPTWAAGASRAAEAARPAPLLTLLGTIAGARSAALHVTIGPTIKLPRTTAPARTLLAAKAFGAFATRAAEASRPAPLLHHGWAIEVAAGGRAAELAAAPITRLKPAALATAFNLSAPFKATPPVKAMRTTGSAPALKLSAAVELTRSGMPARAAEALPTTAAHHGRRRTVKITAGGRPAKLPAAPVKVATLTAALTTLLHEAPEVPLHFVAAFAKAVVLPAARAAELTGAPAKVARASGPFAPGHGRAALRAAVKAGLGE